MMAMAKVTDAKKQPIRRRKAKKAQALLSVISVRISDREKELLKEIMRAGNFKCYSDVLRMAIQMIQVQNNDESK